jgi:hypothetical protein
MIGPNLITEGVPRMTRVQAMLAMAVLVGVAAGCATVNIQETRVITGQVTDESGQPVARNPVLVVGRDLYFSKLRMQYEEQSRHEARAVTDAQGRYRVEFRPASLGNNFFLFFYDVTGFDRIKFRRSEPLDITDRLGRNQTLTVNHALQFNPSWPEVARQIAYYGEQSDRSRILRQHGLPDKRDVPAGSSADPEVWWYYADGVNYWFVGDRLTRTAQFPPMQQPVPAR